MSNDRNAGVTGEELGWVQADLGEARRERDKARADAAELRTALERLERAATVLSNHDRIKQPIRSAGDWSRLHSAIRGARAALAATEGRGEPSA